MAHIVVVEDDTRLAEQLADLLRLEGHTVTLVHDGAAAPAVILREDPAVVLLDVGLPGRDGVSVCREVRGDFRGMVAMLTARTDDIDEVVGLEVGADDYIAKPVRGRVLLARVRALLRRAERQAPSTGRVIVLGDLSIDPGQRRVRVADTEVHLTDAEFDLLVVLARSPGVVLDRDTLYKETRGIAYDGLDRSIDLRLSRLRKKLGDHTASRIKSVRGVGYMLVAP
jgi:two-component system response regulator RstA